MKKGIFISIITVFLAGIGYIIGAYYGRYKFLKNLHTPSKKY